MLCQKEKKRRCMNPTMPLTHSFYQGTTQWRASEQRGRGTQGLETAPRYIWDRKVGKESKDCLPDSAEDAADIIDVSE